MRTPGGTTSEEILGDATPEPGRDPLDACGLTALSVGCDLDDVARCLRALAANLNGADPLERRTLRGRAVQALKALKVTDASGLVDAGIGGGGGRPEAGQGHAVAFADPDPWPGPVDGDQLLHDVRDFFERFTVVPDGAHDVLSTFVLVTHAADVFTSVPYLALESPTPACGKTRALEVLAVLVRRPWFTLMPSTAVLFRVLEQYHPTMLLDECQAVHGRGEAAENVRDLLLAGYKRGGTVPRCVGDAHEVRFFDVTGPKVFALIGELPGALASRCIRIPMQRRSADEPVERFRAVQLADEVLTLTRRARRWAEDHRDALAIVDPAVPSSLTDRLEEIWESLFRVATVAGGDWHERLATAADQLGGTPSDDDIRTALLSDVAEVWSDAESRMTSPELVRKLVALEGRPWGDWKGRELTTNSLARLLKPLKIRPSKLWIDARPQNGYERAWFLECFSRYLPPSTTGRTEGPSSHAAKVPSSCETDKRDLPVATQPPSSSPSSSKPGESPENPGVLPSFQFQEGGARGQKGSLEVRVRRLMSKHGDTQAVLDQMQFHELAAAERILERIAIQAEGDAT